MSEVTLAVCNPGGLDVRALVNQHHRLMSDPTAIRLSSRYFATATAVAASRAELLEYDVLVVDVTAPEPAALVEPLVAAFLAQRVRRHSLLLAAPWYYRGISDNGAQPGDTVYDTSAAARRIAQALDAAYEYAPVFCTVTLADAVKLGCLRCHLLAHPADFLSERLLADSQVSHIRRRDTS